MALSVDLGARLEATVESLVSSGRYNSKSEVLREGVRLVQEREARLAEFDASISRAMEDSLAGRSRPIEDVFAELTAKHLADDAA